MSRSTTLFAKPPYRAAFVVEPPTESNRDGFPSYGQDFRRDFVQVLLTNTLGSTWYADRDKILEESRAVHDVAIKTDPDFAAKAIVYARNHGMMRTQPILALAALGKAGRSNTIARQRFSSIFDDVILTPNDLRDFVSLYQGLNTAPRVWKKHGSKLLLTAVTASEGGRSIKRAVGKWLSTKLSEYWLIKYGSDKQRPSLWDMIRMSHPSPTPGYPNYIAYAHYLKTGNVPPGCEQLSTFDALKRATTDAERIAAITVGRLPHEVSTAFAKSPAVWKAIIPQLPILALLRNLATLERHGVIEHAREKISSTFQNKEAVLKSKILPYRFLEADKHVNTGWVKDALRDAVEHSFANIPTFPGITSVLLDVSPSMKPGWRHDGFMRTAAIFAVAVMKSNGNRGKLVAFDGEAAEASISMRDSLLTQADKLTTARIVGDHTNHGAAMGVLIREKSFADNIVVITDGEQNCGAPFIQTLYTYRDRVNPNVKVWVLDVSLYRNAIAPNEPGITYLYGWSPAALDYMGLAAGGWEMKLA